MTAVTPQPLDAMTLPFSGIRLIEASAGTGKTYTLGILYLRLLLGLGQDAAFSRPLRVDEILVVTFTEAATEELRGRIRENIHQLRLACVREQSEDPGLAKIMAQLSHLPSAARLLLAAERQMDEAAIYTIHGFCQRMLTQNAFESGMLFEQTLIQDEHPLYRQACADFWRRHCYRLPLRVARPLSQEWSGPLALLADIFPYLHGEAPKLQPEIPIQETIEQRHEKLVARIDEVKQQWLQAADILGSVITDSGVDKRSYSSRYLPLWLQAVTHWAQQETLDYQLPKDLPRFSQHVLCEKTKKGTVPEHAVFGAIEQLCASPLSLRDLVLSLAITQVRHNIAQEKRQRAEMGFDDLLSRLDEALQQPSGLDLAQAISQRYPVAMIDEFQDTDPQQYRIFRGIYDQNSPTALLLIGDPKQAIYAFRGADIFTYMQARSEVSAHYTMETNWRSSFAMVNSVNRLFLASEAPFVFQQIPFYPVKPAEKNAALSFDYQGIAQPAMDFWLLSGELVSVSHYQQVMAQHCAAQIANWLEAGQQQQAWLVNAQGRKALEAADITVLVRSRHEATLIREALTALSIPSVYLSNRDSVFETPEARDLLWLLQAVLSPEQERTLRSAMASGLLGLDALTLDNLSQDQKAWDQLVEEFNDYRQRWLQRGVLPMLKAFFSQHHIAEDLLASPGGERRLTDVLHLGELLQETAATLDSEYALVRWLAQQIEHPDPQAKHQQLRLESDRHLVQIVTIHKSKGLEYPLVCLPFISQFRQQKASFYHHRETFQSQLDLHDSEQSLIWAEEERLAEDLRLLYVALTRSVYHCCLGVAPLVQGNKKSTTSDLHLSALGYLLQQHQAGDAAFLEQQLAQLLNSEIRISEVSKSQGLVWQPNVDPAQQLAARQMTRRLRSDWRVTSYSGLQFQGAALAQDLLPKLDIDASGERDQQSVPEMSPHTFARGAVAGTFLHALFEEMAFNSVPEIAWLEEKLLAQGMDKAWAFVLQDWLVRVVNAPLTDDGACLAQLTAGQYQAELQFYLPIDNLLTAERFNQLSRQYDPLSAQCLPLRFQQVSGMLKGFIDLVFCWQGRYYLLDYKSNWLGDNSSSYSKNEMQQAMAEHRYDLQYQLYTLALHRYLQSRLENYDYNHHFGGVIYLFLRGIDEQHPERGVFFCRPQQAFIAALDALFMQESSPQSEKIETIETIIKESK
jgi:exodeoxyribonuclease V beta subunit